MVERGYADFVRAHTAALMRTAYLLTGDGAAAEELVQDTLVRLLPKWHRVEAADLPLAYVRRALTNAFLSERARPASRVLPLNGWDDVDPRDETAAVADRDQLWGLLRGLPARQRAALVLRYFDDLSDGEIAAALDCRAGTARSLISRGLAALRTAMAVEQEGAS